jgi:hypothetical protein
VRTSVFAGFFFVFSLFCWLLCNGYAAVMMTPPLMSLLPMLMERDVLFGSFFFLF